MKYLVIILLFFSCAYEPIQPTIEGTYYTEGLEITFKSGQITGSTICNELTGQYELTGNKININLHTTKVYCEAEFNVNYIRNAYYYELISNKLLLIGENYKLLLYIKN